MQSTIRPVTLEEIAGIERYEAVRDARRRQIIELKRHRRVPVGSDVTLVFENHETVLFQIQEMCRTERITDIDAIREEIEVYNAILPQPGELSATMLIEITEPDQIERRLLSLLGIDECLRLDIAAQPPIRAAFEPGHSREDRLSAVQYVRFALPAAARAAFCDLSTIVRLVIEHPNYQGETPVTGATRASLIEDLRAVP